MLAKRNRSNQPDTIFWEPCPASVNDVRRRLFAGAPCHVHQPRGEPPASGHETAKASLSKTERSSWHLARDSPRPVPFGLEARFHLLDEFAGRLQERLDRLVGSPVFGLL